MKSPAPGDPQRAQFLDLCQELLEHAQLMRNHAMKPGNIWLAKSELDQIATLMSRLEATLDAIKRSDS